MTICIKKKIFNKSFIQFCLFIMKSQRLNLSNIIQNSIYIYLFYIIKIKQQLNKFIYVIYLLYLRKFNIQFFVTLVINNVYIDNDFKFGIFKDNRILQLLEFNKIYLRSGFSSKFFKLYNKRFLMYDNFYLKVSFFTFLNYSSYVEYFRQIKYKRYHDIFLNKNMIKANVKKFTAFQNIYYEKYILYDNLLESKVLKVSLDCFQLENINIFFTSLNFVLFSKIYLYIFLFLKNFVSLSVLSLIYRCFFQYPLILQIFVKFRSHSIKHLCSFLRVMTVKLSRLLFLSIVKKQINLVSLKNINIYLNFSKINDIKVFNFNILSLFIINILMKDVVLRVWDKFEFDYLCLNSNEFIMIWDVLCDFGYFDYSLISDIILDQKDLVLFFEIFKYNLEVYFWQILSLKQYNFAQLLQFNLVDNIKETTLLIQQELCLKLIYKNKYVEFSGLILQNNFCNIFRYVIFNNITQVKYKQKYYIFLLQLQFWKYFNWLISSKLRRDQYWLL